jgi:uncharacterized protein YndB with AHSA1/START domain
VDLRKNRQATHDRLAHDAAIQLEEVMNWIIGIVVVVIVVPLAALFIAGRRANAGFTEVSIDINAPPAAVWRFLDDPELVKKWVGGLKAIEPMPDGREKYVVDVGGQDHILHSTITKREENKLVAQTVTSEGAMAFEEDAVFSLEPINNGTRFTATARWHYKTFFGGLLEVVITGAASKKLEQDLAQLKKLVEHA